MTDSKIEQVESHPLPISVDDCSKSTVEALTASSDPSRVGWSLDTLRVEPRQGFHVYS